MDGQGFWRSRRARRIIVLAPAAAVLGAGVSAVGTARAGTETTQGTPIVGVEARCLDVSWSQTWNGAPIHLWDCNGTGAQAWTVTGRPGAVQAFGKCLDVADGASEDGTPVQLFDCNGSGAQSWQATNGRLVNTASGKCLDSHDGRGNGTRMQIWPCTDSPTQRWSVQAGTDLPADTDPPAGVPGPQARPRPEAAAGDVRPQLVADPALEDRMVELIGVERAKAGCDTQLTRNDGLISAARAHSRLMADRRWLTHKFDDQADLGTRITEGGYRWSSLAENVAPGAFQTPEIAMYGMHQQGINLVGFMESPGHRSNIQNCSLVNVGVGVVRDGDGDPWWTQDFAAPL